MMGFCALGHGIPYHFHFSCFCDSLALSWMTDYSQAIITSSKKVTSQEQYNIWWETPIRIISWVGSQFFKILLTTNHKDTYGSLGSKQTSALIRCDTASQPGCRSQFFVSPSFNHFIIQEKISLLQQWHKLLNSITERPLDLSRQAKAIMIRPIQGENMSLDSLGLNPELGAVRNEL